jgi:hypothetical protein
MMDPPASQVLHEVVLLVDPLLGSSTFQWACM